MFFLLPFECIFIMRPEYHSFTPNREYIAELMKTVKSNFASINDHPDIKALYKEFYIATTGIKYTVGADNAKKSSTPQNSSLKITSDLR